jgi:hypothetical protein
MITGIIPHCGLTLETQPRDNLDGADGLPLDSGGEILREGESTQWSIEESERIRSPGCKEARSPEAIVVAEGPRVKPGIVLGPSRENANAGLISSPEVGRADP